MDIHYRPFNKENDFKKQRKLFELSFPETVGTPIAHDEHYAWKFESFPHSISSYQYIAFEPQNADELVGYYASIPYPYQINGQQYLCGMVCDVMTHPDRRGKGIFTKIGHFSTHEMQKENLAFTTGYPIRPEVIPGHLKVGWKIVLEMPMYLRIVGLKTLLPKPIRFIAPILNPLVRLAQFWTHYSSSTYAASNLSREEFFQLPQDDYQEFLNQWLKEQENALIKTLAFLSWRTKAPHSLYRFIILKKDLKIVGVAIARPTTLKGIESLAVLDFMVLKNDLHASKYIHQSLWKIARHFKKDVIVCMTSSKWAKQYRFLNMLYVKTPAVFSLIVKKLNESIANSELFSSHKWHLFWIDSDDI
jgi:hypothetical protein